MKKISVLLMCVLMIFACACGSGSSLSSVSEDPDVEIVGSDWRTWQPYEVWQRNMYELTEDVYINVDYDAGKIIIVEDSDSYNPIAELTCPHGAIKNADYFLDNSGFNDFNGDDADDLIIADIVDDVPYFEVFLWNDSELTYEFDETMTNSLNEE